MYVLKYFTHCEISVESEEDIYIDIAARVPAPHASVMLIKIKMLCEVFGDFHLSCFADCIIKKRGKILLENWIILINIRTIIKHEKPGSKYTAPLNGANALIKTEKKKPKFEIAFTRYMRDSPSRCDLPVALNSLLVLKKRYALEVENINAKIRIIQTPVPLTCAGFRNRVTATIESLTIDMKKTSPITMEVMLSIFPGP